MDFLLNAISGDDFCAIAVIILIFHTLGSHIAADNYRVRSLGHRASALAFLLYAAIHGVMTEAVSAEAWATILIRGLVLGWLVLGLTWTLTPAVLLFHSTLIVNPLDKLRNAFRRTTDALRRNKECREADARCRSAQEEYERQAPERERQFREAQSRAAAATIAQKLREDARAQCEILYSLYAPDLDDRFPRPRFEEFLKQYMGDDRSPEYVAERAGQLESLLRQHMEKVRPSPAFGSLGDLASWFIAQKEQIDHLPDDRLKRILEVRLNERYAELTSRFLEEINP